MRKLVLTPRFERSFRRFVRHDMVLQNLIEKTLVQMQHDLFAPHLNTHKLEGKLRGLQACWCGYDCRIVFFIQKEKDTLEEKIVLVDIGTHKNVY